jgi:hypothetical protein
MSLNVELRNSSPERSRKWVVSRNKSEYPLYPTGQPPALSNIADQAVMLGIIQSNCDAFVNGAAGARTH